MYVEKGSCWGSGKEKNRRGKMDAIRMAKRSVSKEEMGNFFLSFFLFPSIPFILGGGSLSRERGEILFVPKKAFDEKESTYTKTLDIPPRSRAQFVV